MIKLAAQPLTASGSRHHHPERPRAPCSSGADRRSQSHVSSAVVPLSLAAGGFLADLLGYPAVWIIAGLGYLGTLLLNLPALGHLRTATDPQ